MIRRSFTTGALVALLLAAPALGKGTDGVVLSGGGQEVMIAIGPGHGTSPELAALVKATHLYDVDWWNGDGGTRPFGELGPRISAEWNFPAPVDSVIVQHLYPFAADGPVGHVPAGQDYMEDPVSGAWHPLRGEIVEVLEGVGFDTEALLAADRAGAGTVTFERVGWVIALGALLALAAIMRGRRIRQVA
jgi:hypothetical protein